MTRRARQSSPVVPAYLPGPGAASTDPLAGVERVFIDGSNLLFALGRRPGYERGPAREREAPSGGAPPMPAGAVIGRLRAAFPPNVSVELVFDGRATGGVAGRLATGLRVSYSGRETADRLIDEGVLAQLNADGPAGTWGILVVTDDRGLRNLVVSKGARVAGTAWLARRIGHASEERPIRAAGDRGGGSGRGGGPGRSGTDSARPRGRGGPSIPGPKAGTTLGHRRAPRSPESFDRD